MHLFVSGALPIFWGIDIINKHSALYRNAYLLGLPFFIIGYCFRIHEDRISTINERIIISGIVIGTVLSIIEGYINHQRLYIGTVVLSLAIFTFVIKDKNFGNGSLLFYLGNKLSLNLYIVHFSIGIVLLRVFELLKLNTVTFGFPIVVLGVSLGFSLLIYIGNNQIKKHMFLLLHR